MKNPTKVLDESNCSVMQSSSLLPGIPLTHSHEVRSKAARVKKEGLSSCA